MVDTIKVAGVTYELPLARTKEGKLVRLVRLNGQPVDKDLYQTVIKKFKARRARQEKDQLMRDCGLVKTPYGWE